MLLCPAPATTMSKRSSLEVCGPNENGATARGASAVAFTNSRRLIVLMGAPPGDQTFTPSSPLPRCWFRNLSASPSLRSDPVRRSPIRRDGWWRRSDINLGWASDAAPNQALVASHRSEEHTSELQSRLHLVCRLLLEKKKHN